MPEPLARFDNGFTQRYVRSFATGKQRLSIRVGETYDKLIHSRQIRRRHGMLRVLSPGEKNTNGRHKEMGSFPITEERGLAAADGAAVRATMLLFRLSSVRSHRRIRAKDAS